MRLSSYPWLRETEEDWPHKCEIPSQDFLNLIFPSERLMTAAQQTIISAPQNWGEDDNTHWWACAHAHKLHHQLSHKPWRLWLTLRVVSSERGPWAAAYLWSHPLSPLHLLDSVHIQTHQVTPATYGINNKQCNRLMLMSPLVWKHKYSHCQFRVSKTKC